MPLIENKIYTVEEYNYLEDTISGFQIDFWDGKVKALPPFTETRVLLGENLQVLLGFALAGTPHKVFNADAHIALDEQNTILHTDVFVACDKVEDSKIDIHGVANPSVVFEVIGKTPYGFNRSGKMSTYSKNSRFEAYYLLYQDRPLIETFVRKGEDLWHIDYVEGLDKILTIEPLNLAFTLAKIYEEVIFEPKKE